MEHSSNPVADTLIRLGSAAQAAGLPHLIIGGNAVIHHGVPRFTRDVDFLIPEKDRDAWHALAEKLGYELYHSTGSFSQFESSPGLAGLPPLDLMAVDDATWNALFAGSETELLAANYLARWPSPLHLIALKLHAWRGTGREEKELDWSDIQGVIRQRHSDREDSAFRDIVLRYGGVEALEKINGPTGSEPSEPS